MNWEEVRDLAKTKLEGTCRVCNECDGNACSGRVPGVGGIGNGKGFIRNVMDLDRCCFNVRTMHDIVNPNLTMELLGSNMKMPVLAAPIGDCELNYQGIISDAEMATALLKGVNQAGLMGMVADVWDFDNYKKQLQSFKGLENHCIPVLKPWLQDELIKRVKIAEETGCAAVAINVDAFAFDLLNYPNNRLEPKNVTKLTEIVNSTSLPVIIKGIMTPDEAEKAVQTGAKAIVVSNHGGRIVDTTPSAITTLEGISYMVEDEITILVDGGIRSGNDVLKCLALGADAVLIGRPLALAAIGAGANGVSIYLEKIYNELKVAMVMAGVETVQDVSNEIVQIGKCK